MIVPILMAIWFGYRAKRAGKNVMGWTVAGVALSFVVATAFAHAGFLLVGGSLLPRMEPETYIAVRIVTAILSIVAMIVIGQLALKPRIDVVGAPEGGEAPTPPGPAESGPVE